MKTNTKRIVEATLKSLTTKNKVVEVVNNINPNELTTEGKKILSYLMKSFVPEELKGWKLSEMKTEVLTLLDAPSFVDMENAVSIMENATKKVIKKTDTPKVSDEEAKKLLDDVYKNNQVKTNTKLTDTEVIELCGYRYTYPEFPKSFESPLYEGKVLEMLNTEDVKEVASLWDATVNTPDEIDYDLVVVMYFPEYERNFDIDPHGVLVSSQTKKSLLKGYGGKYPHNLDVQGIVHFDAGTRMMVSVSVYTGIPYATTCQPLHFEVNERLKCRVTQNGLDYQIYKIVPKK